LSKRLNYRLEKIMGLTIHFKLKFQSEHAAIEDLQARWLVEEARKLAFSFKRKGRVDGVGPLGQDRPARKLGEHFLKYCHPEYGEQWAAVLPVRAWMFVVDVGADCEPLRLGLCQYPARVWHLGGEQATRLSKGWRLSSFSKTQYASLHGWEHFRRCHTAVIDLLHGLRRLGLGVEISDEGDYWPGRSVTKLRAELDQMNGVIAAAAGALKDFDEALNGQCRVQSPIFAHRQFERLEAEVATALAPKLKQLRNAIGNL
jgi:hypothetical protein